MHNTLSLVSKLPSVTVENFKLCSSHGMVGPHLKLKATTLHIKVGMTAWRLGQLQSNMSLTELENLFYGNLSTKEGNVPSGYVLRANLLAYRCLSTKPLDDRMPARICGKT